MAMHRRSSRRLLGYRAHRCSRRWVGYRVNLSSYVTRPGEMSFVDQIQLESALANLATLPKATLTISGFFDA